MPLPLFVIRNVLTGLRQSLLDAIPKDMGRPWEDCPALATTQGIHHLRSKNLQRFHLWW